MIAGNWIGTDVTGSMALADQSGISLAESSENTIGGTGEGAGNVISGNATFGIQISSASADNVVAGNVIGTDSTGTVVIANATGIYVGSPSNTIGGTAAGAGNLISGNTEYGIYIQQPTAIDNLVEGNRIGTNRAGTAALGNSVGVLLQSPNNTIGGTAAAQAT